MLGKEVGAKVAMLTAVAKKPSLVELLSVIKSSSAVREGTTIESGTAVPESVCRRLMGAVVLPVYILRTS